MQVYFLIEYSMTSLFRQLGIWCALGTTMGSVLFISTITAPTPTTSTTRTSEATLDKSQKQRRFKVLAPRAAKGNDKSARAWKLLQRMMQVERTAEFSGVSTISGRGGAPIKMRVWRQANKRRYEYVAPPVKRGDLLVDDGQNVWLYHRAENAAVQTKTSRARMGALRSPGARRALSVRVTGETKLDGRDAWVVDVRRLQGAKETRRFLIDKDSGLRLGMQLINASGVTIQRQTLQDLRLAGVDENRFRWQPPAGVKAVRTSGSMFAQIAPARRTAQWLKVPSYVPNGYVFESAVVDNASGEAWLRYANTARRFSIFQQRATEAASQNADTRYSTTRQRWMVSSTQWQSFSRCWRP
jgi:outer membrane lipoprotein-sorting protein